MQSNVLVILFLFVSIHLRAQSMYKMDMDVQEIGFNDSKSCTPDTPVIWGIRFDTICFMFTTNHLCFFPIGERIKFESNKKQIIEKYIRDNKITVLVQDFHNEKYTITMMTDQQTGRMLIFITNIDFGFPSYVLSFGTQICN